MRRLALILSIIATLLSSGGVARVAHMMTAHGGAACTAHAPSACSSSGHRHESRAPIGSTDDCAVCDELASLTGAPAPAAPCAVAIAFLAIVHDREAGQVPAPAPIAALGARPPPHHA
ncbi:MAG: hypothetical protein ACO31E_05640 [Phycisphaerales bacterium]